MSISALVGTEGGGVARGWRGLPLWAWPARGRAHLVAGRSWAVSRLPLWAWPTTVRPNSDKRGTFAVAGVAAASCDAEAHAGLYKRGIGAAPAVCSEPPSVAAGVATVATTRSVNAQRLRLPTRRRGISPGDASAVAAPQGKPGGGEPTSRGTAATPDGPRRCSRAATPGHARAAWVDHRADALQEVLADEEPQHAVLASTYTRSSWSRKATHKGFPVTLKRDAVSMMPTPGSATLWDRGPRS